MSLNNLFTNIADAIRTKKGITTPIKASDFPSEIESIEVGESGDGIIDVDVLPIEQVIDENNIYRLPDKTLWMYKDGSWVELTVGEPETEELTVTPNEEVQEFTPSEDAYFNKITVEAIQTENRYLSATETSQTYHANEGKYIKSVSISGIKTETTSVKSGNETQTVKPTSGYYFKQVTVEPSDLIDLTEMPEVSSVEDNKIYRVTETIKQDPMIYMYDGTNAISIYDSEYSVSRIIVLDGPECGMYYNSDEPDVYYGEDELIYNVQGESIYSPTYTVLISKNDNNAYVLIDQHDESGYGGVSCYEFYNFMNRVTSYPYPPKGLITDVSEMTEVGYYTMYESGAGTTEVSIIVPNQDDKEIYTVKNGEITEVGGDIPSDYVGPDVPTVEETTIVPSITDQTIESGQYLLGQVTVKGDANLVAENIKEGVTLYSGTSGQIVGTCASGGGAASGDMLQARVDAVGSCENLFSNYEGDNVDYITNLDLSNITSLRSMFYYCTKLTTIPLIDTSNITFMSNMFEGCYKLTSIPLLNTSSNRSTNGMFKSCKALTTIPLIDTSSTTDITSMFDGCSNLTSIPLLNTSKATITQKMFNGCTKLTTIPLIDTSNVTDMSSMFYNCSSLTDIPELNTSNVISMGMMFYGCTKLTTIPSLDTSSARGFNQMFYKCTNLTTVPAIDVSNVTSMSNMFDNCKNLKSILMYGMKVAFNISSSTLFEREDLVTILNNLATVTSTTKLTMGSTNLAKLTDEDKLIATNKGWTLA